MKNVSKLVVRMGLLSVLSVMPLAEQIDNTPTCIHKTTNPLLGNVSRQSLISPFGRS